jgi:Fic family protein
MYVYGKNNIQAFISGGPQHPGPRWIAPGSIEPHDLSAKVRSEWDRLFATASPSSTEITAAYSRLLCIETNELEDIFRLSRHSVARLVCGGFYVSAIQHIDSRSNLSDRKKIVAILKDVQLALDRIICWTKNPTEPFSQHLILDIHNMIMTSNRIITHMHEGLEINTIVPTNEWRRKSVYSPRYDDILMFFPFDEIPNAMTQLITYLQPIFDNIKQTRGCPTPYTFAAWLHHTLISIHPFLDGNGRMTRMLSSLPLIMSGLPPIIIASSRRDSYFKALKAADTNLDIAPLAKLFATEQLLAIQQVHDLTSNPSKLDMSDIVPDDFMETLLTPFPPKQSVDTNDYMETLSIHSAG